MLSQATRPGPTITTSVDTASAPRRRARFQRSRRDRVVRGVAGGLGARTGVDPVLLRIFFVVLTLAGGAGILLYALGMVASDEPPDGEEPPSRPFDLQQAAAVGLVGLGVLLVLRNLGLWFGDALVWPALLAGVASAVIWTRGPQPGGGRAADPLGLSRSRWSFGRIAIGATLTGASALVFLATASDPVGVLAPLAGVLIGVVLLFAPWLLRLWEQLGREREEAARAAARDEVAAHLHDSVLQTLALIQRASDQPRRMVTLARQQERELRAWLYGDRDTLDPATSLAAAVDALVGEVEAAFGLEVDVVVVGDAVVDDTVAGLLGAIREALVNVGKHAGVDDASLYVEATPETVEAFVRDRGAGFDPASVPADRRGLRGSVHGRLRRLGGGAHVEATPGTGVEVELWVPRVVPARPVDAPDPDPRPAPSSTATDMP
jgi:signal transduction histidine kinase/phage shock protein PspC (stress-responsive transcriptional regulator)